MNKQRSSKKSKKDSVAYSSLYNGSEIETELVHSSLVGDKVLSSGMCLEPHEVILCDQLENPFNLKEDNA